METGRGGRSGADAQSGISGVARATRRADGAVDVHWNGGGIRIFRHPSPSGHQRATGRVRRHAGPPAHPGQHLSLPASVRKSVAQSQRAQRPLRRHHRTPPIRVERGRCRGDGGGVKIGVMRRDSQ